VQGRLLEFVGRARFGSIPNYAAILERLIWRLIFLSLLFILFLIELQTLSKCAQLNFLIIFLLRDELLVVTEYLTFDGL
jgi:hypothetical protein